MDNFDILVVDDEEAMRESIAAWLTKEGFRAATAASGPDALEKLAVLPCGIVLADIKMPGMGGLELLSAIKEKYPSILVVMITAYGSVRSAVAAMKQGASDYLMKPFDPEHLILLMGKLMAQRALMDENHLLKARLAQQDTVWLDDLIGGSEAMGRVFEEIETVAQTDTPVLITGETGTGKELTARAIHSRSSRRLCPFVPINCAAVHRQLLESELFGHERGAFTGAVEARRGRLELADNGTLFLDEVGDIQPALQTGMLRVLEEGTFLRLGGTKAVRSDFRLICATHRDLGARMDAGRFRQDFYFRINVINICLPALREREGDIPLLGVHFLQRFAKEMGKPVRGFDREALGLLKVYPWPGNVRELKNVVERAVVLGKGEQITRDDLKFLLPSGPGHAVAQSGRRLKEMEKAHITRILEETGWKITRTAEILDINRTTLARKIKAWHLKPANQRSVP